jgi:hypothetical protein
MIIYENSFHRNRMLLVLWHAAALVGLVDVNGKTHRVDT